jgi:Tfp pilus assembly protein PilX
MNGKRNRGSALMVVVVVMAIVAMYAVANTAVLYHLHEELRMLEKEQVKKFERP